MFHKLRSIHKWIGLFASIFLVTISISGFFLSIKGWNTWVSPEDKSGAEIADFTEVISVDQAAEAAFALDLVGLKIPKDIDRLEYRVKHNVYKILSKEHYHEVQIDGKTGKVLSVGRRNDQFFEDIHDFSIVSENLNTWVLPLVASGLFVLGVTGVYMFSVPVYRRWKFSHKQPEPKT